PGLRAVKIAGEFILADDLSDSEVITAGMGGSNDYKLLGHSVANGTNISWPSISVPQTHRDLEIRWRASHQGSGAQPILLRFTGAGANTDHRFATKYVG